MLALLTISIPMYFVPAFIAGCRHSKNGFAIFVLNLFTGWTLIGWIAAFIWACVSPDRTEKPVVQVVQVQLPDWDSGENKVDTFLQGYRP